MVQSSKHVCNKNSCIHSALSSFALQYHDFFAQWCSLPNLCSLYSLLSIAELVFWGLFSVAFQAARWGYYWMTRYLPLLPNLLRISFLLPLVTAYWWNKQFLKMTKIFNIFSHNNLCVLCFSPMQYFFSSNVSKIRINADIEKLILV